MKLIVFKTAILTVGLSLPLLATADITKNIAADVVSPKTVLSQPSHSDKEILTWASTFPIATFSYYSTHYGTKIQKPSGMFTDSGWSQFMNALNKSNFKNKQFTVSAEVTTAPVILEQGSLDNVYSWKIQIPLRVTYQNLTQFRQLNKIVTMQIMRTSRSAAGDVTINQFTISPASGANSTDKANKK